MCSFNVDYDIKINENNNKKSDNLNIFMNQTPISVKLIFLNLI